MKQKKPEILVYDVETGYLKANLFRLGKQVVTHSSLDLNYMLHDIICISYRFDRGKVHTLHWGYGAESSKQMIEEFDKIIKYAQDNQCVIIGKNNKNFDDRHINTLRWHHNLPAMPQWMQYTDDLEKQIRKYFYLGSYALDFTSKLRGRGGKVKMDFQDWVDCVEYKRLQILKEKLSQFKVLKPVSKLIIKVITPLIFGRDCDNLSKDGLKAMAKMFKYSRKDVRDTSEDVYDVKAHCGFKSTQISQGQGHLVCMHLGCPGGGSFLRKNGKRCSGGVQYQEFMCTYDSMSPHYAGRAHVKTDGSLGKMMMKGMGN